MTSYHIISRLPHSWTEADILLMPSLRKQMKSQFESSKSHTVLWTRIKKKLEEHGVKVTVTQVSSKFKAVKKEYKAVTDHNNVSGNNKKTVQTHGVLC